MVDRQARDKLAEDLRHAVSGRLTDAEFEGACPQRSDDTGVTAIWDWGSCLYNGDMLFPHRLRGRYKVSPTLRRTAARAIVFLHTGLEYEWPVFTGMPAPFGLPACYLLMGVAVLLVALAAACVSERWLAVQLGALAALLLACPVHWLLTYWSRREATERFYAAGDQDLWPFLHRSDYEASLRAPRLLSGRSSV
jgi:hypothetical protein